MNLKSEYDDPETTRWALALWTSYRAMKNTVMALAAVDPTAELANDREVSIVGESFANPDGSSRQEIIAAVTEGETAFLLRERTNRFDQNSIAVCVMHGQEPLQIGHLARDDAAIYAPLIDTGAAILGQVSFIGGGDEDFPLRGVRITVCRHMGATP